LPELKPGTRVNLLVQEADTLLIELRTKFIGVLEDEPATALVIDDAEYASDQYMSDEILADEVGADITIAGETVTDDSQEAST